MANIELDGGNKKITVDSGDLTLDIPGDIILDADGADLTFADGGTNILKVTNSSSDVVFQNQVDAKDIIFKQYDGTEVAKIDDDGSFKVANSTLSISQSSSDVIIKPLTDAKDIIFQQYDGTAVATVEDNGTLNIPTSKLAINGTAITSTAAELNILDGVTATASELNLLDGGTSVGSSITLADSDGVVVNDGGTMKTIPASDFSTYAGGAMTHIGGSQGTSAVSNVELQGCFSNDYVAYYCLFSGAATTTSSSSPFIRFLDGSNSVIDASNYKYAGYEHTGGSGGAGAAFYHDTSAFQPMHTSSMGNSTNLPFDIHMWFSDVTDSGHKPVISWIASGFFHGYSFGWTSGSGGYDAELAPAGLHFAMNGGNIREYNIRIWGRKA